MIAWKKPDPTLEPGRPYHMRDMIPRFIPDSLDDLQGAPDAVFELPVNIYWGPRRGAFHISDDNDAIRAYTEIVTNAGVATQCRLLNKERLIELWPQLFIDRTTVREPWERRFPELRNDGNRPATSIVGMIEHP